MLRLRTQVRFGTGLERGLGGSFGSAAAVVRGPTFSFIFVVRQAKCTLYRIHTGFVNKNSEFIFVCGFTTACATKLSNNYQNSTEYNNYFDNTKLHINNIRPMIT